MILVHDGGKTVAENSSAVYHVCSSGLESQNEVEFALLQSVHQFLHGAVLDVELYMRIGVEKGDERLGHDVAEGERYADVQFACKHFLQIVHVVYTGFGRIDRVLGIRSQFLARLCEVNLMRIALEEGRPISCSRCEICCERVLWVMYNLREASEKLSVSATFKKYFSCRISILFLY